jgi:hypothetical protein
VGITPNLEESSSNIEAVLQAALSFMKTKIITNDCDKIGVVLFGCEKSDNALGLPNISVLMKLDMPDATTIKNFGNLVESSKTEITFAPKSERSPLHEALWACH